MVRFDGQLASDVIVRYFFFQAEDGIRDVAVTGVQTCALPISSRRRHTRCSRDWSSDVCSSDLLTFGEDLAWQERKAASFVFTPLYSGYDVPWTAARGDDKLRFNGFVKTASYA